MAYIELEDDGQLIIVRVPYGRAQDVIIEEVEDRDDEEDDNEIEEIFISPYDIEEE